MKQTFVAPELKIVNMNSSDVIATSNFTGIEDEFELTV